MSRRSILTLGSPRLIAGRPGVRLERQRPPPPRSPSRRATYTALTPIEAYVYVHVAACSVEEPQENHYLTGRTVRSCRRTTTQMRTYVKLVRFECNREPGERAPTRDGTRRSKSLGSTGRARASMIIANCCYSN